MSVVLALGWTRWRVLPVLFSVALATGCGVPVPGDQVPAAALVAQLPNPPATAVVTVVDLGEVRRRLETGDAGALNRVLEAVALPALFGDGHLGGPIDVDRIDALAVLSDAGLAHAVFLYATDQPFDEVERALEASGYERQGDLLHNAGFVVAGFDGGVVQAREARTARAVLDPDQGPDALAADLAAVGGPVRTVHAVGLDCADAFAIGWEADRPTGEIALLRPSADTDLVVVDEWRDRVKLTRQEADDGVARWTYEVIGFDDPAPTVILRALATSVLEIACG